MKIEKIHRTLFFAIIFFLSSQVGIHFWPEFSRVAGIRVDYLSPTLYLLDLLIISWIAVWSVSDVGVFKIKIRGYLLQSIFLLFALSLFWNVFNAKSLGAHIFGIIKFGEFGLFSLLVARLFNKDYIRPFIFTLASSAILSSILAVWQFAQQSSVGGFWYFFGERTFNTSTIGISTVNLGEQILRPYAAFPHPNVLAFFLLLTIIFAFLRVAYEKKLAKTFLIITIMLSSVALILTFSRIMILLAIWFFFHAIYTKGKLKAMLAFLGIFGVLGLTSILFFPNIFSPAFIFRGIDFRQELLGQSLQIFLSSPYFGIGFNNFFIHQSALTKDISPILFQPPHNIFVLSLLSLGLFGWWIFPAVFIFAIQFLIKESKSKNHEQRDFSRSVLFVLISIIFTGMFDHFLLTLEQGQIILALILGLSFAKINM